MHNELSGNTSYKAINNMSLAPLSNIYKQLKDNNARDGQYFKIIDAEMGFYPVYKIASNQDHILPPSEPELRKEMSAKEKGKESFQPELRP